MTKVFAFDDAATLGLPGARALVRTYREVWPLKNGKPVDEPSKEVAYHASSKDAHMSCVEVFATDVRSHWKVETYHGRRDLSYMEDKTARRVNEKLMSAMFIARTIGLWQSARHPERTTEETKTNLFIRTRNTVHLFTKRGLQ